MHSRTIAVGLIVVGLTMTISADPAAALQDNPVHTHVGHVATGFGRAPDGAGLLPTAQAEAQTAIQHVDLAWRDTSNLEWMQTHAAHVLHAVDPSQAEGGPGLGFGVLAAAEGIAQHIELAAGSDGASDAVRTHANHVATAARAVAARATEIAELGVRMESASDYTSGEGLIAQMRRLSNELITGADVNGDGQIGWGDGEGGLQHVEQHLGLLMAAEGL